MARTEQILQRQVQCTLGALCHLEDLSGLVALYAYIGSMAPLPLEAPNSIRILVPTLASLSLAPQRGADVQRATCTSKRAGLTVQRAICTFMGEGHLVLGLQPISILVPRIWFHVPTLQMTKTWLKLSLFDDKNNVFQMVPGFRNSGCCGLGLRSS